MPYIKQEKRERLDKEISMLTGAMKGEPGELSYVITKLLQAWYPVSYEGLSQIVGVLELTKQEFIRRVVEPYEDDKIKHNGDVF